ncbi:MAG: TrkA family potassium uptake protein [Mobilicoccus sp.]|nr:TrkA family potassium uptake protein [Mobilicoccus sp.]
MHFVIMGCGRVGAGIALALEAEGHDVAVIDRDKAAFRRLGPDFDGRRVTGVGFDRDTLERAGIAEAYAFAAVSSGDNSNIIAARVARETYGVDNVVARIYDPGRAEVYGRLGIPTVGTVRWTTERIMRRLLPRDAAPVLTDPTGSLVLAEVSPHPSWIGRTLTHIEKASGSRVAYYTRLEAAAMPTPTTVLQEHDVLTLIAPVDRLRSIERLLLDPPSHG